MADEIQQRTGKETRVCVLGHLQRGAVPTTFDRLLCTRFGVGAVRLISEDKFGVMVAYILPETMGIPLQDAIGQLSTVPSDGDIVRTGRALGISVGDRSKIENRSPIADWDGDLPAIGRRPKPMGGDD